MASSADLDEMVAARYGLSFVDPLETGMGQYKVARGRAGSTGAFRSGLQAEDAISLENPVAQTTGEREFALAA